MCECVFCCSTAEKHFFPDCTFQQGKIIKKNNVEASRKANDLLTKQLDKLHKEVLNLKEGLKPWEPLKQHGAAESLGSKAPSAKDVQWLSDGYDELHSANGCAEESLNSIEYRLQQMADKVFQISKAVDEIQLYSYQYNVTIVGVPQVEGTSESAKNTSRNAWIFFQGLEPTCQNLLLK